MNTAELCQHQSSEKRNKIDVPIVESVLQWTSQKHWW